MDSTFKSGLKKSNNDDNDKEVAKKSKINDKTSVPRKSINDINKKTSIDIDGKIKKKIIFYYQFYSSISKFVFINYRSERCLETNNFNFKLD
jgi:hypothetical protein